jgi:PBP1b-binding outer membrane lipoprotein LpoB
MKRLALAAAVVALAACSTKSETPAADTAAPAMTPAPAAGMTDSSAMKGGMMDSSAMKMDSAAMKGGMTDSAAMKKTP